jgi:periplasmic divalent cation tolerance protein
MGEAHKLSDALIGEKLAACVNLVPQIHSTYWWKGQIEKTDEVLLIIKTQKPKFKMIEKRIKQLHSYKVPEILALTVVDGNPDYLKWLKDTTA